MRVIEAAYPKVDRSDVSKERYIAYTTVHNELNSHYADAFGVTIRTIVRYNKRYGVTYKVTTVVNVKQNKEEWKKFQEELRKLIAEGFLVAYQDESGVELEQILRRSHSPRGKKSIAIKRTQTRKRLNFIGLRINEELYFLRYMDRSMNAPTFEFWLSWVIPQLPQKTVFVLDNAAIHKRPETIKLITEAGHKVLWLPPYSPELNKIEPMWNVVKKKMQSNRNLTVFDAMATVVPEYDKDRINKKDSYLEFVPYPEKVEE